MWIYEKKLQYPVNIKRPNAAMARIIISQYGGPNCNIYDAKILYISTLCAFL